MMRSYSYSENYVQVLVEDLQLLNLLHVVFRQLAVRQIQPFQLLKPQQYLSHHLCRNLVGHHAQPFEFDAVSAYRKEALFGHSG